MVNGANGLINQSALQIVVSCFGELVAVGLLFNLVVGVVANIFHYRLAVAVDGCGDLIDALQAVSVVVDFSAGWQSHRFDSVTDVVLVLLAVVGAVSVVADFGDVAVAVVFKGGGAALVCETAKSSDAEEAVVVVQGDVFVGIRVADRNQSVECVVVVASGDAACVGMCCEVVVFVVAIAEYTPVGANLPDDSAEWVVLVFRLGTVRGGNLFELAVTVVAVVSGAEQRVDLLADPVARVVLLLAPLAVGIDRFDWVAVGIVADPTDGVALCTVRSGSSQKPVEGVEGTADGGGEGTVLVELLLLAAVAVGVVIEGLLLTEIVGDGGDTTERVVVEDQSDTVGGVMVWISWPALS